MKKIIINLCVIVLIVSSACKENASKTSDHHQNTNHDVQNNTSNKNQNNINTSNEDAELVTQLKHYLNSEFLTEGDRRAITDDQRKFQFQKIDLNDDGKDEIFVKFGTTYFCGTGGCTVLLLSHDLKLITKFSPTGTLYVETTTKNGWRTLATQSENDWKQLIYQDGTYPSNPTVVASETIAPDNDANILFDPEQTNSQTFTF